MMEKCFDEGTLQAFLDNELAPELSLRVARHVADCEPCAFLLAEIEEETAFAFAALEQEFNSLVPTQRLWTKINRSIESQHRQKSVWQRVLTFVSGLSFANPHVVAFGSLLLIVGVVSALIVVKNEKVTSDYANVKTTVSPAQTAKTENPALPVDGPSVFPQVEEDKSKNTVNPPVRPENANFVKRESNQKPFEKVEPRRDDFQPQRAVYQYLDGEENYVATIARLEQTVNQNKDEVLKPSARFSYEKDLAVVNDTISKMRREVKKNPKNEDAKQILFASYQNKIELLNSVTQRGELMASLR